MTAALWLTRAALVAAIGAVTGVAVALVAQHPVTGVAAVLLVLVGLLGAPMAALLWPLALTWRRR
jgi:hypothetical protein